MCINRIIFDLSLFVFVATIMFVHDYAQGRKHVPFRDSALTMLLEKSLSGSNNTTHTIVNCSSEISNKQETMSTLRFGVIWLCGRMHVDD